MHDLAVALDEELVGDLDSADLGDAADIVAAEIEQHQMLGAFFRIGEEFGLKRLIVMRRGAARSCAGNWTDSDFAARSFDQDFRARSGDGETAEIEEIEIGRGIDPAQRAIERNGCSAKGASKRCDSTTWKISPAAM